MDTGLNARRGNGGDQCPAPKYNMKVEYRRFIEDMTQKGIEVECNEATDIKTGNRIFVDHKGMIDFQSLADQGKDISKFPSHVTVAYRMGQDIPSQKERFIGFSQGPKSANEVLHLVNFANIRNPLEKLSLVSAVLNGAEDAGYAENIAFINYE